MYRSYGKMSCTGVCCGGACLCVLAAKNVCLCGPGYRLCNHLVKSKRLSYYYVKQAPEETPRQHRSPMLHWVSGSWATDSKKSMHRYGSKTGKIIKKRKYTRSYCMYCLLFYKAVCYRWHSGRPGSLNTCQQRITSWTSVPRSLQGNKAIWWKPHDFVFITSIHHRMRTWHIKNMNSSRNHCTTALTKKQNKLCVTWGRWEDMFIMIIHSSTHTMLATFSSTLCSLCSFNSDTLTQYFQFITLCL